MLEKAAGSFFWEETFAFRTIKAVTVFGRELPSTFPRRLEILPKYGKKPVLCAIKKILL